MKIQDSQSVVASFPTYDRDTLRCGIAHMSVGGFHRAHLAEYMDRFLQTYTGNTWMIHGIGNLDTDITLVNAMNAQGNLYTLTERSGTEDVCKVIGSIKEFTHAPSDPAKVIEILADNDIKIISLTITEKGYCYDSSHNLDPHHPMIKADLTNDGSPISAIGFIFEAAKRRMENGGESFTVMSCDNLPGNGHVAQKIIDQFSELKDPRVAQWIRNNVSFPNAMVDRITPAPSQATIDLVKEKFGVDDPCAVACESFQQWIIEDNFANGRPAFELVGAQFVPSVEPYEKLKVRALNGSHSALSYISYLMGYHDVDKAMTDPLIREFVINYMSREVGPTLPDVPGIDIEQYFDVLIARFSNPAISDQVQRLAMDGSAKIPNAIVPVIEHQRAHGGMTGLSAFAIASWYQYLGGVDDAGNIIKITDPLSEKLTAIARANPNDPRVFLTVKEIFGETIGDDEKFALEVENALTHIRTVGTRRALDVMLDSPWHQFDGSPLVREREFKPTT